MVQKMHFMRKKWMFAELLGNCWIGERQASLDQSMVIRVGYRNVKGTETLWKVEWLTN